MDDDMARISVDGKYSLFTFHDTCIKFRTSTKLKRYVRVKEWDNGYLVVDADYSTLGETEEYVDIASIVDDLYIDTQRFLKPINNEFIQGGMAMIVQSMALSMSQAGDQMKAQKDEQQGKQSSRI